MRVAARDQAFSLFCDGATLAETAEVVGVHRSTTERWSREFNWRIHRQRVWNETRERILKERIQRFVFKDKEIATKLHDLIAGSCAEFEAVREGKLPKRALKFSRADLVKFAEAYICVENVFRHKDDDMSG